MASALRLSQSALRAAAPLRTNTFNGLRCYSTGKTQVRHPPPIAFAFALALALAIHRYPPTPAPQ